MRYVFEEYIFYCEVNQPIYSIRLFAKRRYVKEIQMKLNFYYVSHNFEGKCYFIKQN